jgi:quinol monooxygenase YgiN
MIIRIVRMSFSEENIEPFLDIFNTNKIAIRNFEGCSFLELYRDKNNPNVFFTYSYWYAEAALENYRQSSLFKNVWKKTKSLFNNPAEAWSVDKIETLE